MTGKMQKSKPQQPYVNELHNQYMFDGKGYESVREKHMLAMWMIRQLVPARKVGTTPIRRRTNLGISWKFFHLVAIHMNMVQIGNWSKMSITQIKAVFTTATLNIMRARGDIQQWIYVVGNMLAKCACPSSSWYKAVQGHPVTVDDDVQNEAVAPRSQGIIMYATWRARFLCLTLYVILLLKGVLFEYNFVIKKESLKRTG